MSLLHSPKKKPSNAVESDTSVSLTLNNRKRPASAHLAAASDSEGGEFVDSAPPKRVRTSESGSPEYQPMSPASTDSSQNERQLILSIDHLPPPEIMDRGVAESPNKRSRRPTEKALYMSKEKIGDRAANPRVSSPGKPIVSFAKRNICPSPDLDRDPVFVKSEPQKDGDASRLPLRGLGNDKGKKKYRSPTPFDISDGEDNILPSVGSQVGGKRPARPQTPINLSSSEDDDPTPTAPTKSFASAKKNPQNKGPTQFSPALQKGAPGVVLSKPVPIRKTALKPNVTFSPTQDVNDSDGLSNESDELPPSIISPSKKSTKPSREVVLLKAKGGPADGIIQDDVYLEDISIATPSSRKTGFSIEPFDPANGPAGCPPHLLHTENDGTSYPIELIAGAFDLFDGDSRQSILSALIFKELRPFVNVASVPRSKIYAEKYKHQVMWSAQNRSVIFTMLGSVQGCHLVSPTVIGAHTYKAIKIIPYGESWRKFQSFLGEFYGQGPMRGPFEYGCLLTLTSRRDGGTTQDASTATPVTPKKNSRAFGGSTSSAEWFDAKLPNCVDFNKQVPIYDATRGPFLFAKEDFAGMPSLPLYREDGMIADLPTDSIVSVFFSLASYASRNAPPSVVANNSEVLSVNIQYVIYYGSIPCED